ncbi:unnamed protein product [Camellia sinensis]
MHALVVLRPTIYYSMMTGKMAGALSSEFYLDSDFHTDSPSTPTPTLLLSFSLQDIHWRVEANILVEFGALVVSTYTHHCLKV